MVERLTVFFLIVLLIVLGLWLAILPWFRLGLVGDWENNFFVTSLVRLTGATFLQGVFASAWVRGAVTGLGILNLIVAFFEILHFNKSVEFLSKKPEDIA
jgi:hypothetical protein